MKSKPSSMFFIQQRKIRSASRSSWLAFFRGIFGCVVRMQLLLAASSIMGLPRASSLSFRHCDGRLSSSSMLRGRRLWTRSSGISKIRHAVDASRRSYYRGSRTGNWPSLVVRYVGSDSGGSTRGTEMDDQGRRIRRGREVGNGWYFDEEEHPASSSSWDEFDPLSVVTSRTSSSSRSSGRSQSKSLPRGGRNNDYYSRDDQRQQRRSGGRQQLSKKRNKEDQERKINMKALERAGFVHLYGIASVRNALMANRRDFTRPEDRIDMDLLEGEDYEHESRQRQRKPEAQFSPWLFVQERGQHRGSGGRSAEKSMQVEEVLKLAEERGIPVASVDKGVLNTLSGNRPHQGVCLRCGQLDFEPLTHIPMPAANDDDQNSDGHDADIAFYPPTFWLVLDEVVDPQNLGALLRSAYFLGFGGKDGREKIGVLVCAKNSAPPSPTVSAASAGALELATVYSTSNLPRTLAQAEQDGFRIIGASAAAPPSSSSDDPSAPDDVPVYDLQDLPPASLADEATLLVLGSEGHGLRSLVAKSCTAFVRVPPAAGDVVEGVDSLNVSVTGGILLWHLLRNR